MKLKPAKKSSPASCIASSIKTCPGTLFSVHTQNIKIYNIDIIINSSSGFPVKYSAVRGVTSHGLDCTSTHGKQQIVPMPKETADLTFTFDYVKRTGQKC